MGLTTTATFRVNGEERTLAFPTHHTLLEVLREECVEVLCVGFRSGTPDGRALTGISRIDRKKQAPLARIAKK